MPNNHHITRITLAAMALALGVTLFFFSKKSDEPPDLRELTRSQLELRGDRLFAKGETEPFAGTLVERYDATAKRTALEIHDGKPHGISRGWYENGQLEVEEHFVDAISHGTRTRWYENGAKKSEAKIVDGQIEGTFSRWHDNGQKAAEAEMLAGIPHGVSRAWDREGRQTALILMEMGEVKSREHFEVSAAR